MYKSYVGETVAAESAVDGQDEDAMVVSRGSAHAGIRCRPRGELLQFLQRSHEHL